ncbi:MAG: putative peptidase rane zinc metallopeptidase [Bacteroidetes bacterium]|nr:putative peptidase rane zinc metallopeptidase [Bacteroidota bacterium]
MSFLLISLLILGLSWWVQYRLKSKMEEYSKVPFRGNMSGAQVAAKMLRDHGIYDVTIQSVDGKLSDFYNPFDKTVNLSPEVYQGTSVTSAAIAAHECGHAVQHANAYFWLGLRSRVVPFVNFAANWVQWILLAGMLLMGFAGIFGVYVLLIGVALFAVTTVFSFITLPVEFDASNRALAWLDNSGSTSTQEHAMAKDALTWAAMTYVVAALGSLVTLLYYISMFLRRR